MRDMTLKGLRLLSWGMSVPWMATPSALRSGLDICIDVIKLEKQDFSLDLAEMLTIQQITREQNRLIDLESPVNPQSVQADTGDTPAWTKDTSIQVIDGIAIIPVQGMIYRYADMFTMMCGGTTTQALSQSIRKAQNDSSITAIVLEIDSPGGEADGISELARQIRNTSKIKPVVAHGDGDVASAAYYLAAAAGRLVVSPSSLVGCIGTICTIPNPELESGPKSVLPIVSKQSPKKHIDTTTKEGRDQIQTWVDDISQVFINDVAEFRGTTPKKVEESFGQGDVLIASKALKAGMVDAIGGLDDVLSELRDERNLEIKKPAGGKRMGILERIKAAMAGDAVDPELERSLENALMGQGPAPILPPGMALHNPPMQPSPEDRVNIPPIKGAGAGIPEETPQTVNNTPDPEVLRLREEVARYQAKEQEVKIEQRGKEAKDWATSLILSGRAFPAEQAALTQAFLDAASDDDAFGPIKAMGGDVTRVSRLQALHDLRPATKATGEQVPVIQEGEAPQLRILENNTETPHEDPDAPLSPEDNVRYLSKTATGRMLLQERGIAIPE